MHKFSIHSDTDYRPIVIEAEDMVAAVEIYRRQYANRTANFFYVDMIA